jgi:type IV secretory pathway VirB2 component (pilin)
MRMKKLLYLVLNVACVSFPQLVAAANIPLPSPQGLPDRDLVDVIASVTRFVTGLVAVLAVLMIVISGIVYITSAGESDKITRAKSWLTYSIIGLVVSLLAYVIVIAVGTALGVQW